MRHLLLLLKLQNLLFQLTRAKQLSPVALHQPASALGPKSDVVSGALALQESKNRRIRQQFLVEGFQNVEAALEANLVSSVFVTDWQHELAEIARRNNIKVQFVTDAALKALADAVTPQGIVAVCEIPRTSLEDVVNEKSSPLVVCIGVGDPGNLGTIIRTAAAFNAGAVITSAGSADAWSSKTIRSTAGAFASLPILSGLDEQLILNSLSKFKTLATTGAATPTILDKQVVELLHQPHAWIFGNEAHGLGETWLYNAAMQVNIPVSNKVESLNVASAAAVCLFASAFAARFSS